MEHYAGSEANQAGSSVAVAAMTALGKIIERRCVPASNGGPLTSFDSVARPRVQLPDYAKMLDKHLECSRESFILTLVYIDRLLDDNPDFMLTPLSTQKLFLTGLVVAAKFHDDEYMSNQHYAHVGGLRTRELNSLEAQLLTLLRWRLVVSPQECEAYLQQVLLTSDGFGQEFYEERRRGDVCPFSQKASSEEPPVSMTQVVQPPDTTPDAPPTKDKEEPTPAGSPLALPLAEAEATELPIAYVCSGELNRFLHRCSRCGGQRPHSVSRLGFRRVRHFRKSSSQGRSGYRCICPTRMAL